MKQTIDFLRRLACNNNREWFQAHKAEYKEMQERFNAFTAQLIAAIGKYHPEVGALGVSDCTYRIYRDVRFSSDKSPYKTHFGAFIAPGGKKSGYAGYYFHVSLGADEYPNCHMLASGHYCHEADVLRVVREDIVNGEGDFDRIVKAAARKGFRLDTDNMLKRNPKGFATDAPYPEYLRLKNYCLVLHPDTEFVLGERLAARVAELFRPTKPLVDYVNRAIDYVRETRGL